MSRFDRTESAHTERNMKDQLQGIRFGEVVKVHEHTEENDFSNHEVDVLLHNKKKQYRHIPVSANASGEVSVPTEEDDVIVGILEGDGERAVVLGILYTHQNPAPLGEQGMYRLVRGNLYVEMDPEGEYARLSQKSSDDADEASATIEIDDAGEETIIKVMNPGEGSQMGLELNLGTGEFKLGDGAGYGIVSDGNGNFNWYEQSVNFIDDGSTINW